MSRIPRPSPAMAVAFTALALAVGGTSYAAVKLPAKSVGTPQLKDRAVTSPKIRNGSVTAEKLTAGSVTTDKLPNGSVTAAKLDPQAMGVQGLTYETANYAIPPHMGLTAPVDCPAGTKPISGGVKVSDPATMAAVQTFPQGAGWTAGADNFSDSMQGMTVFAICAQSGSNATAPPKTADAPRIERHRAIR